MTENQMLLIVIANTAISMFLYWRLSAKVAITRSLARVACEKILMGELEKFLDKKKPTEAVAK